MWTHLPVLGVCGWSGAGKTTLIERVVAELSRQSLSVAVVKHDCHGFEVDRRGKDSDRLFRAGASVCLQGPEEQFIRAHGAQSVTLDDALNHLGTRNDLVLVEGHKHSPFPKVWLLGDDEREAPSEAEQVIAALPRNGDRLQKMRDILADWLPTQWLKPPLLGCLLIGGKSSRMGRPKHLLPHPRGGSWIEHTVDVLSQVTERVVVCGLGDLPPPIADYPRLPDVTDAMGPMAGLLAAMRWAPHANWLLTACDLPNIAVPALDWLLGTRSPGVWATLPRRRKETLVEPLLAYYDLRSRHAVARLAADKNFSLARLADHPKVIGPCIPENLEPVWENINSFDQLAPQPRSWASRP